jgi:hypothetical protein
VLDCRKNSTDPHRRFCIGVVPSIEEVPSILHPVSVPCCLFLAIDSTTVSDAVIRSIAKGLLRRGIAYLCVWGPDCERVHDQFDLERMPDEPKERVVMTTWHSEETLSDALWFFATCAKPDAGFESECTDWVALSVMNDAWARTMRLDLLTP